MSFLGQLKIKQLGLLLLLSASLFTLYFLATDRLSPPDGGAQSLQIYAYSSFVNSWGPGPELVRQFEQRCQCEVDLVDAGDSALLLQRLLLESEKSPADIVIGLDQLTLVEAAPMEWLSLHEVTKGVLWANRLPQVTKDQRFVPIDWAPLTIIYHPDKISPPASLQELKADRLARQLTVADPRLSTSGFHFLVWFLHAYGIEQGFQELQQLAATIHSIAPSWSASYGLFKKRQVGLTFTYLTSPVYHWQKEDRSQAPQPLQFSQPHPYQIEYAAVRKGCHNCEAAKEFVRFLLEPASQKKIMEANFMLPVVDGVVRGTLFEELPNVPLIPAEFYQKAQQEKTKWLARWKSLDL